MRITGSSVYVINDNRNELEELKIALEGLYSQNCSPINSNENGEYAIDVAQCIPKHISKYLGSRTRSVPGPECYSYALFPLGITKNLIRVMEASTEIFFTENSPFCTKWSYEQRRAGDIVYMNGHGFMYLTDKFSMGALGAGRVFDIATNDENIALSGGRIQDFPFYRCSRPNTLIPQHLKSSVAVIDSFGEFLKKYLFSDGLTQESLKSLAEQVAILERQLTKDKIDLLLAESANPSILLRLYELSGAYYTISKIESRLQFPGRTQDLEKAGFFKSTHLNYLKVLDRMAKTEHAILFDATTLSTIDDYCESSRNELPNLCRFFDLYQAGERLMFAPNRQH